LLETAYQLRKDCLRIGDLEGFVRLKDGEIQHRLRDINTDVTTLGFCHDDLVLHRGSYLQYASFLLRQPFELMMRRALATTLHVGLVSQNQNGLPALVGTPSITLVVIQEPKKKASSDAFFTESMLQLQFRVETSFSVWTKASHWVAFSRVSG